nr:hypothetical protein [Tanacetum cinerariifolium]
MPLTPSTSEMLNDENFTNMKKGVRIINDARGGVIVKKELVDAGIVEQKGVRIINVARGGVIVEKELVDAGIVEQATLDVFTIEPTPKDNILVNHENITVTPHLGVAIKIPEDVVGALKGELAATAFLFSLIS